MPKVAFVHNSSLFYIRAIKSVLLILSISAVLTAIPCGFLYALEGQDTRLDFTVPEELRLDLNSVSELKLDSSPVHKEILRLIDLGSWFKTLQQYIKVPLPGTGVEGVEVDRGKVSELNLRIGKETGVDLLKFLEFFGKVLVILLEGIARIIRDLILNLNG